MRSFFAAVWLLLSLKCDHSSRFISEGMDNDLSKVEQWAVRLHFLTCRSCRRFRKSMEMLQQLARQTGEATDEQLQNLSRDFHLSAEARDRIAAVISAEEQ